MQIHRLAYTYVIIIKEKKVIGLRMRLHGGNWRDLGGAGEGKVKEKVM